MRINKKYRTIGMMAAAVMAVSSPFASTATAQLKADGPESTVYAYRSWSGTPAHDDLGLYKISPSGEAECVWIDYTDVNPAYFISGWIRNGELCGIYGNRSGALYIHYEMGSGYLSGVKELDIEGKNAYKYMFTAAYNPDDDYVYGFSYNEDYSIDYLVKAPADDLEAVEIIRRMPNDYTMCMSICFNPIDHHMYGIDFLGDLIRIDTNGNFEVANTYELGADGKLADYATGMCYSPFDKCFYWNRQLADFGSSWVRIDAETFEYEKVAEMGFLEHYTVLACIDHDGDEDGPSQAYRVGHAFDASGNGTVTVQMPATMANGDIVPETLSWTMTDMTGGKSQTGTAEPGKNVEVKFEGLSQGEHNFRFVTEADGKKSQSLYVNAWVGLDKPARVENIKVTPEGAQYRVAWDAVAKGAHGGLVNTEDITYTLYINKAKVAETKELSALVDGPTASNINKFEVMIVAKSGSMISDPTYSDEVAVTGPRELPYVLEPTEEQASAVKMVNVKEDNSKWRLSKDFAGNAAFLCTSDQNNAADDWLILPALIFDDSSAQYEISFMTSGNSNVKTAEFLEVTAGSSDQLDKLTELTILPRTQVAGTATKTVTQKFSVPAAGNYHVGIHCVSDANMAGVYVRNIKVVKIDNAGVGELVNSETAVKGGKGEIIVSGTPGTDVTVYTLDGRVATSAQLEANVMTVGLKPGAYIVICGNSKFKVLVK